MSITDTSISDYNNLDYMELEQFKGVKSKNLSISLNDINNNEINNNEDSYTRKGSPAFGKGRLSILVDEATQWNKEEIELKIDAENLKEKQLLKASLSNKTENLRNSSLPPFEKYKGLLGLIVEQQDGFTNTDKKNKAKDIREILKELKAIDLSPDEAEILCSIYERMTISQKDTEKAIKYLKTIMS